MADKRMFAKSIVLSDDFLDMPMSTRCLYFTLGMLADDDGFIGSPKSIMRQCGASQDDMLILLSKSYLLDLGKGVIVIKHWRINNYLRSDRYKETIYQEQKAKLTTEKGLYVEKNNVGIPSDYQVVYTDKNSIDKNIYMSENSDELDQKIEEHFKIVRDLYPKVRWGSKAKALKIYKQYISSGHKYCDTNVKLTEKQIYYAVQNYVRQQESNNTEPIYYKNFETLMNQLSDYVEREE